MKRACLLWVAVLCASAMVVQAKTPTSAPAKAGAIDLAQAFHSSDARYRQADETLNAVRLAASNAGGAKVRIARLKDLLAKYPDYPYRAVVYYYLGLAYQTTRQYHKSVPAFIHALRADSGLATTTPILRYLSNARVELVVSDTSTALIFVLVAALILTTWGLVRRGPAVRWGRLLVLFGGALALWLAAVWLVPWIMGCPKGGLEAYSKPTMVDFHLGQLGDRFLWTLFGYGAGGIFAAMVVSATASRIRSRARIVVGLVGTITVTSVLIGLFYVRHCYHQSTYHSDNTRLYFMARDIATKQAVPREMLPMYGPIFRAKIIQAQKQAEPAQK